MKRKKQKSSLLRRISQHFFLRNMILAISAVLVITYLVSLSLNLFTRHGEKYRVPDLVGMTITQSSALIKEADLKLVINDSIYVPGMTPGAIIDQSPEPQSYVKSGRKVFLVINSVSPRSEVIPYVTGYSLRLARNLLQGAGFEIEKLVYRDDIATNNVIGQQYKGREILEGSTQKAVLGEKVTLVVGRAKDAPLPSVPRVVGLSLRDAQSRLWETGLNIGNITYDKSVNDENRASAKVYRQGLASSSKANYGATVTLHLTADTSIATQAVKEAEAAEIRAQEELRILSEMGEEEEVDLVDGNVSEEEFNALFQ